MKGREGHRLRAGVNWRSTRLSSVAEATPRDEVLERAVGERLVADYDLRLTDIRIVRRDGGRGGRARLIVAARDLLGKPVAVAVRGPAPVGPLVVELIAQTLVILLALLVPLLWLLGRATRPLERLTAAARAWRPGVPVSALTPSGPADVRGLIVAFGNLSKRIDHLLTEKDVMLGAIGHDLRTPLSALRIDVESLMDDAVREPMIVSLDRLAEELESILTLARTGHALLTKAPVELAALLADVVAGHATIRLEASSPAVILGDPAALRRAFANLVHNAERYGGRGSVDLVEEDAKDGARAIVRVADDGPGLPVDALVRAGEPFVRFETSRNRATGGHGLGLAIARATFERHGGTLTLANRQAGGLEAKVLLPLAKRC